MIDFHCHLDLYPKPHDVAQDCVSRGVYVLSVTTTPSSWVGTSALAKGAPRIRTALGLHPQLAHERHSELALFERLIEQTDYVGEIGLDGGPEYRAHWDVQCRVLRRILAICGEVGGRIMSLHTRRSAGAVLDELSVVPLAGTPILHWFSGTQRELARAISMGCWFSVGPGMLRSENGMKLVARMPPDRVLTESDGPFVRQGSRAVWPWEAADVVPMLATCWDQSVSEVGARLLTNLRCLGESAHRAVSTASQP